MRATIILNWSGDDGGKGTLTLTSWSHICIGHRILIKIQNYVNYAGRESSHPCNYAADMARR